MTTETVVTEMIKHEGMKWVLYSKDGGKVLGRFDSEAAAKKHEAEVMVFKARGKEGARLGLAVTSAGEYMLAEGGCLVLTEMDMARLDDDHLLKMRRMCIGERSKLQQKMRDLPEAERYGSTAAAELWQDVEYYNQCIRMLEMEMQHRMLMLDADHDEEKKG